MRLLLVFLFSQISVTSHAQFWLQLSDFPGNPRDDAAGFSINDIHYCGTGRDDGFSCTRNFARFNGSTQEWEPATPLPDNENRQYASGFSYNNQGYILCGDNCAGDFLSSFWKFDPTTEQWSTLPNLPSTGRAGCVHFIIGDSLYLIGGQNSTGILNEVWMYCFSTQEWHQKNSIPMAGIWRGFAFTYNNEGFIATGKSSLTSWNNATWKYSPSSDSWSNYSLLNFGERTYVGMVQRDSCLYIFGGLDPSDQTLTSLDKVNLENHSFQSMPFFSASPRKGVFCFFHNTDFYLTTGISENTRLKETWKIEEVMTSNNMASNYIAIYPVPTIDYLFVEVDANCIGEFIYLTDQFGKIVCIHRLKTTKDQLSLTQLSNGTYHLIYRNHSSQIIKGN